MSRDGIDYDALIERMRAYATLKAEEVFAIYNLPTLEKDAPDYPFAEHPGQRSVRDPASQSVTQLPYGIQIAVQAEGADFLEHGNAPGGSGKAGVLIGGDSSDPMFIPLKKGKRPRGLRMTKDGNFAVAQTVKSYAATHRLRNAIIAAFGLDRIKT